MYVLPVSMSELLPRVRSLHLEFCRRALYAYWNLPKYLQPPGHRLLSWEIRQGRNFTECQVWLGRLHVNWWAPRR